MFFLCKLSESQSPIRRTLTPASINILITAADRRTASSPSLGDEILITVARGCTSKAVGHKGKNKLRLINEYGFSSVSVREDDSLAEYDVLVEKRKDIKCI